MSLKSKALDLLNGKSPDLPGQAEVDAALSELRAAEKLHADINVKREALHRDLATQERALGDAALLAETSGSDVAYKAEQAAIAKLRQDVDRLDNAATAATLRIAEAKRALHLAGRERHVKMARKQITLRNKYASQAAEALAAAVHAFAKLNEHSDRIAAASPVTLSGLGLAVEQDDINRLIATELARLQPLGRPGYAFPGTEYPIYGDPAKATPFVDAIAQCNERILRLIADGPVAEPVEMQPAPAPVNHSVPIVEEQRAPLEVINTAPIEFEPIKPLRSYGSAEYKPGVVS